jgi:hypothetical protein
MSHSHVSHTSLPAYDPAATWQKGCPVCEERGNDLPSSLGSLDRESFQRAWWRMLSWNNDESRVTPGPEAQLMWCLYSMAVALERFTDLDPFNEPLPGW